MFLERWVVHSSNAKVNKYFDLPYYSMNYGLSAEASSNSDVTVGSLI